MAAIGRFVLTFTYSFSTLWSSELFPTSVRSLGVGVFFTFEIFASSISPFVVDFSVMNHIDPLLCITAIGFLGCISSLFLKETLGVDK